MCLASNSMWRAQAWRNPFYENDAEVPGQHCLDINLKARDSLYESCAGPNKVKRMVWLKDAKGNRTEQVPLLPDYDLLLDPACDTVFLDEDEYVTA